MIDDLLSKFEQFCKVDRNLAPRTLSHNNGYLWQIRRCVQSIRKHPLQITEDDIRNYLTQFETKSPHTKANVLKALRVFFKHFLKMPEVVESFKFPKKTYRPRAALTKLELQKFYNALDCPRDRTLFLMFCSTGLRRNEVLGLTIDQVNVGGRLVYPNSHETGTTKKSWMGVFNTETQDHLREYLTIRRTNDKRLFPMSEVTLRRVFKEASRSSTVKLTPQDLRFWHSNALADAGIPDRFVDALQGRTPTSVLAKHYSDFAPERLKTIYDKANLRVLD